MNLETEPTLWERLVWAFTGNFPASWHRRDAEREALNAERLRAFFEGAVASGRWTADMTASGRDTWRQAVERRCR